MSARLFRQISENLNDKTFIEVKYGYFIDSMLSYRSDNLEEELAQAFNSTNYKDAKTDFFEGYKILHTDKNLFNFKEKFGIKSTLFDILVSKENWEKIQEITGLEDWSAAGYYFKDDFVNFNHKILDFKTFGMAVASLENPELYEHEALHALKQFYSRNLFLNDWYYKRYEKQEMQMKVEFSLLEELLCFLVTGRSKKNIIDDLRKYYMFSKRKYIYNLLDYTKKEKKKFWRWLNPVTKSINEVVRAADWIHGCLGPRITVPLFFSLGPTIREIERKEFHSPFDDIIKLREYLSPTLLRNIRLKEINQELAKKGFRNKSEHLNNLF